MRNRFFRFYHAFLLFIGHHKLLDNTVGNTKWYRHAIYEEGQWVIGNRPNRKRFVPKYEEDFLKEHPLCIRCYEEGKFRKSVRIFNRQEHKEALCQEHWDEAEEDYFCGWG